MHGHGWMDGWMDGILYLKTAFCQIKIYINQSVRNTSSLFTIKKA